MTTKLILKRIVFYVLSFTWGIIISLIGLFPIAVLACMKRVHVFHGRLYGVVGKNWGGVNFGWFEAQATRWGKKYVSTDLI